eukprot:88233-Chlamydomonas_euryale.AAC.1
MLTAGLCHVSCASSFRVGTLKPVPEASGVKAPRADVTTAGARLQVSAMAIADMAREAGGQPVPPLEPESEGSFLAQQ